MTPRALRFERGPTIWRPSKNASKDKAVTVMVDLSRDENGCMHARRLDAVPGRSGRVFADWLTEQGVEVTVTVEHAALDPFRGYANAIRDALPETIAVLDAFHVVKLAGQALDWGSPRLRGRSGAGLSRPPWAVAGTRTTRSTGSGAPCSPASSTSPPGRPPG